MTKDRLLTYGVVTFGLIEIIIGCITFLLVILSLLVEKSAKPPEVLIFVLTTAVISLSLGIGILRKSLVSYHLLLFFSTVIILSKILIFAKIIYLSGALETTIPSPIKNTVSIVYHSLLILYFIQPSIRKQFKAKRSALFSLKSLFCKY
jgi:hypothetical protein